MLSCGRSWSNASTAGKLGRVTCECSPLVLITLCFILSFVGLVVPVLPGRVHLAWGWGLSFSHRLYTAGLVYLGSFILLTGLMLIADQLANAYAVKRYGGSRLSVLASLVGCPSACFSSPLGFVLVPFFLVLRWSSFCSPAPLSSNEGGCGHLNRLCRELVRKGAHAGAMIVIFLMDI